MILLLIIWLVIVTLIALYAAIGYIDHINRDPITRKREKSE